MAVAFHEDALRAALRAEYGIDLRRPDVGLLDLAALTGWLPAGCVLWQAIGGPLARSREEQTLHLLDLRLRQQMWVQGGKKGAEPTFVKDPPFAHERRQAQDLMSRKAAAWARRQGKK